MSDSVHIIQWIRLPLAFFLHTNKPIQEPSTKENRRNKH
jgi:hypothetical protein